MQNKPKNFLEEIVKLKEKDLPRKTLQTKEELNFAKSNTSNFLKAFESQYKIGLITEVKFASPTSPNLGSPKDLLKRVKQYEKAGATAISLITEKHFFKGDTAFVSQVKKHVGIPVLQKDFVIDESQIYEAKEIGSDALLLIARLVDTNKLNEFVELCFSLGIEPVVEIANEEDLKKAVLTQTNIIAVNARDLETFVIDIEKASVLMKRIPDRFIKLGFSGIHSRMEVGKYQQAGARGVLVGTSLMQTKNIGEFITSLQRSSDVKVKICGMQQLEDAQAAIEAGADYIGFIFAKDSKRSIDRKTAKKIIDKVRGKTKIVGVFKDNTFEEINSLCEELGFDLVQLHGEIDERFCQKNSIPVIRSFGLPAEFDKDETIQKMKQFDVPYYMVDRLNPGEGESLSLESSGAIAQSFPLFFAGGLTPDNVADVVVNVRPYAVDVITGVKTEGKFDSKKMKQFIQNAKGANL